MAQMPTATILGIVTDSTGATVPEAKLTARNIETGQTRTATSAADGSYRFSALPVGKYEVRAEKNGFQTNVRSGLTLDVAQEAVVNFALQVGSMVQEVVVSSEAPLVNTTSGSLGGLVDEQQVAQLPMNGRNYVDLTLLQPGITQHRSLGANPSNVGLWYSSNGAPVHSNNFLLDGASMSNLQGVNSASASGYTLGVDGIREYRIITNSFSAEYGMTMGSQVLMVSKGGANKWSGDVFEYLRNSALDARNFFDATDTANINGFGTDKSLTYPRKRLPPFQRNNFGGAFGGPIQKDKTFFFAVYEGVRQRLGVTIVDTVFPAADHVATANPGCGGCTVATQILPLLALYPNSNMPNNGFTYPFVAPTRDDYGQIRVDHTFSANDSLFARYTIDNGSLHSSVIQNAGPWSYPGFTMDISSQSQYTTLAENHVFSPSLLNTARFSVSRTTPRIDSGSPYAGSQYQFVPGAATADLGLINIAGVAISPMGPFPTAPAYLPQNILSWGDDIFYTRGRHSFKFGTLINRYQQHNYTARGYRGTATFNSISEFLQGKTSATLAYLTPTSSLVRDYRSTTIGFYAQDDFRVTSRFTLNLGLRYEFMTQLHEKNGVQDALVNVRTDASPTVGPPFKNPTLHNASPRLGFAWDVRGNGKTAVRGGYALLYDLSPYGTAMDVIQTNEKPFTTTSTILGSASSPITVTIPFPVSTAIIAHDIALFDYNIKQQHLLSYNLTLEQQLPFSMGLSVAYAGSRGLNLMSRRDANPRQPNGVPSVVGGVETCVPLTSGTRDLTSMMDGSATACWAPTVAGVNPNPYINPAWASILLQTGAASSNYNALQVVLNKRVTKGLQFQSAYTWSKMMDFPQSEAPNEMSSAPVYPVDAFHNWPDYAVSNYDATHNWRFNATYRLPQMSGKSGLLPKVANGWQVSGIESIQTGYPFTVNLANNQSGSAVFSGGTNLDRPDLVPGRSVYSITHGTSPGCIINPGKPGTVTIAAGTPLGTPNLWFDPCAFTLQPAGFLGNEPRNMLRGPGLSNLDFSLLKDTAIRQLGENGNMEFRVEIFNLLNHADFAIPGNHNYPSGGAITTTGSATSRQIQLALKLMF
ncbi:MAG: TonB-dependent receptor [Acidobacteriia bacterium]|nr:TonB-dependent receptor [Terriglobia bacterium]